MSANNKRAKRVIGHLKQIWDDMDYAQRRLIELNFEEASERSRSAEIEGLEASYRLESPVHDLAELN